MKRDAVDRIEIASPCTVSWSSMRGDDRVRFCGQCRQNVYNVEGFGRAEARRLVAQSEGRLCVRILRRPDGTVVTADCWTRLRAARRRGVVPFLAMLLVVGWTELVAIRFGLDGLRRLGAKPAAPDPSFVSRHRLGGVRTVSRGARTMGAFAPRPIGPDPELAWLQPKQVPAPPRAPIPHLTQPLVNPVLAGRPD
jgi:hypothetical protein